MMLEIRTRTLADHRLWTREGTALVLVAIDGRTEEELEEPSSLPGWSRKHLLAHLDGNAQALANLAHWAATGIETPMYASPDQRRSDIEDGSLRFGVELRDAVIASAGRLTTKMDGLTEEQWGNEVRTGQGRTVRATQIPWLRAREVMLHAVDLDHGVSWTDLPDGFLVALVDDIVTKRSAEGTGPALRVLVRAEDDWTIVVVGGRVTLSGSLPAVAASLHGRESTLLAEASGEQAPVLPPWL